MTTNKNYIDFINKMKASDKDKEAMIRQIKNNSPFIKFALSAKMRKNH